MSPLAAHFHFSQLGSILETNYFKEASFHLSNRSSSEKHSRGWTD